MSFMQSNVDKVKNASVKIFRSQDIIQKEALILDNLSNIESYFEEQLYKLKQLYSQCSIKFDNSSIRIVTNNVYSSFFLRNSFAFDFSFHNQEKSIMKAQQFSFFTEDEYSLLKKIESLFLTIDIHQIKFYFDTLKLTNDYIKETELLLKNDFESKSAIIENFFVKEHPQKEWRKNNIKSDFYGIYLSFNKQDNIATIHHYNFEYNRYKGQLERKQNKVTYKQGKYYVDKNIVFNDQLILNISQLNNLLPIFKLTEIERKPYNGSPYKDKIYACDIDILLEFVNAACF